MDRPKTHRWLPFYFWLLFGGIGPTVYAIFKALNIAGSGGYIFFSLVLIAIRATTCWGIYTRSLWGWYLNFVALFGIPALKILALLQTPRYSDTEHAYAAGALAAAFFLLIYAIPNAIYFQKRKYLFDNGEASHKTLFDRWRVLAPYAQTVPSDHPISSSSTTAPTSCQKTPYANVVPAEVPNTTLSPRIKVKRDRNIADETELICEVMADERIDQFVEFADIWEGDMENANDEIFYEMAQNEIISGQAALGLMLKAEIAAGGDEKKTRLIYLQARASQLYQEHLVKLDAERARIRTEELQREKQQELERQKQQELERQKTAEQKLDERMVPVSEFAEKKLVADWVLINRIKEKKYVGRELNGEWYIDPTSIKNK